MPEARINESCIIGLPTCGYAFSSSRMAFIATPADDEFALELDVLNSLLQEKEYESYIALQKLDPAKLAFCTKICSKIIASQFCIVLLNSSSHREHPDIKIPNPNVHLEYGLMMAFKKHILPFQQEGDALAFNIRPLDTILYNKGNFKKLANEAIDSAIISGGTTSRPTRSLTSNENLLRYANILGLRVSRLDTSESAELYKFGSSLGFLLLDGLEILYLGIFDMEPAKEVAFRLKLLLQSLHNAKQQFDTSNKKSLTPDQIEKVENILKNIRIEVVVSLDIDKEKTSKRIKELTQGFEPFPWKLINNEDIQVTLDQAYDEIGDI